MSLKSITRGVLACLLATVYLLGWPAVGAAQMNADGKSWHPPQPGQNNIWFANNPSSSVAFVFVHGLESDSRCWLYAENGVIKQYWPYLVWADARFDRPAIFLGGYRFDANYLVFDAVKELREALTNNGVLNHERIIFVAHSLGGVVVRRLLVDDRQLFRAKQLGLLLLGSPSDGSTVASVSAPVLRFLNLPQGNHADLLRKDSRYLTELDQEFRDVVEGSHLSAEDRLNLTGAEAVEGDAAFHGYLTIVDRVSATRNFMFNKVLPGDHFSIVKPTDLNSQSHQFVADFYARFTASIAEELRRVIRIRPPVGLSPDRPVAPSPGPKDAAVSPGSPPREPQPAPAAAARVIEFSGDRGQVAFGEPLTLRWRVVAASRVRIEPGPMILDAGKGEVTVPSVTTASEFTLTALGSSNDDRSTSRWPIKVVPKIVAFDAAPFSDPGKCDVAILRWTVKGASTIAIDNGVGVVDRFPYQRVRPLQTVTYTLTARGAGGASLARTTVSAFRFKPGCSQP